MPFRQIASEVGGSASRGMLVEQGSYDLRDLFGLEFRAGFVEVDGVLITILVAQHQAVLIVNANPTSGEKSRGDFITSIDARIRSGPRLIRLNRCNSAPNQDARWGKVMQSSKKTRKRSSIRLFAVLPSMQAIAQMDNPESNSFHCPELRKLP